MALSQPISDYFDQLIYAIGNYHYNWHPSCELLMVIQGRLTINVEGYQFQQLAFLFQGQLNGCLC